MLKIKRKKIDSLYVIPKLSKNFPVYQNLIGGGHCFVFVNDPDRIDGCGYCLVAEALWMWLWWRKHQRHQLYSDFDHYIQLFAKFAHYGAATYLNTWVGRKIANDVKMDLFDRLMANRSHFFDTTTSVRVGMISYNTDVDIACNGLLSNLKLFTTRVFLRYRLIFVLFTIRGSWR